MLPLDKHNKFNLIVAAVLMTCLGFFSTAYYGPAEPLTQGEIDQYMQQVRHMFETVGVPDGNGGGELETFMTQFRRFAETDDGKPFYMVNLMKWRDKAVFRPHIEGVEGMTPKEADLRYNELLFHELLANASHTAYLSSAIQNALNYGASSEDVDNWSEIGIFRYRSRRDFFNMVGSEDYRNIVFFKLASMGTIVLTPTQVHGLAFNPMPNIPALLGILLTIGYLVFLLLRASSRKAVYRNETQKSSLNSAIHN